MASIYPKKGIIYISWYDSIRQRRRNLSLNLKNTPQNMKKALRIKKAMEEKLKKAKDNVRGLSIKRKTIQDAFEHFLQNNSSKHPKTIKDYYRFFDKFKGEFDENKPCMIITKLTVEQWLNELKKLPVKKNTIFGYFKQLNHFLNFLFEYNYIPMFKINRDVKPKVEIVEKIIIKPVDMAIIFAALSIIKKTENFKNLLHLLYYTGLRASDLLSLEIQNVDIESCSMKYYSPKKKVYRTISFHEDLIPVFNSIKEVQQTGKVLDYKNVESLQQAISDYFQDIQLKGNKYTSRSFRKTFITVARKKGLDETVVKELVGHEHASTADRYYNKIDEDIMRLELKKYPSINNLPYDQIVERINDIKQSLADRPTKLLK